MIGRIIAGLRAESLDDKRRRFPQVDEECLRLTREKVNLEASQLRRKRNALLSELRKLRKNPHYVPTPLEREQIYKKAVKGGPLKPVFYPHQMVRPSLLTSSLPSPLGQGDDRVEVVSSPSGRATAFTDHFHRTFVHAGQPPPDAAKPWLMSGAGQDYRDRVAGDSKAKWPVAMTRWMIW